MYKMDPHIVWTRTATEAPLSRPLVAILHNGIQAQGEFFLCEGQMFFDADIYGNIEARLVAFWRVIDPEQEEPHAA